MLTRQRFSWILGFAIVTAYFLTGHAATASCGRPAVLPDGWQIATADDARIDDRLCALDRDTSAVPSGIHGLVVVRKGWLVFEAYRSGIDEPWGKPRGTYAYDAATLHDARSIAKSVMSLLVGIAVDRHLISSVDDPIFPYLPQYADLRTPEKDGIRIRDLLSMTSGFVSNEMVPYRDANNTERLMAEAADPYRFVLERKLLSEPGTNWAYSGGSTMLLAAILTKVTGQPLDVFAKDALFEPLGISSFEWIRLKRSGEVAAYGGLRLRPRDIAKLGQLVLDRGEWRGRRIVSTAWIAEATMPRNDGWYPDRYAFHWWSGHTTRPDGSTMAWTAAVGIGGQRLFVVPDLDLVVVISAGLYDQPKQNAIVRELFEKVLAAVR